MNAFSYNTCRWTAVSLSILLLAPHAGATNQDAIAAPPPVGSAEVLSVAGGLFLVIAAILLASARCCLSSMLLIKAVTLALFFLVLNSAMVEVFAVSVSA